MLGYISIEISEHQKTSSILILFNASMQELVSYCLKAESMFLCNLLLVLWWHVLGQERRPTEAIAAQSLGCDVEPQSIVCQ